MITNQTVVNRLQDMTKELEASQTAVNLGASKVEAAQRLKDYAKANGHNLRDHVRRGEGYRAYQHVYNAFFDMLTSWIESAIEQHYIKPLANLANFTADDIQPQPDARAKADEVTNTIHYSSLVALERHILKQMPESPMRNDMLSNDYLSHTTSYMAAMLDGCQWLECGRTPTEIVEFLELFLAAYNDLTITLTNSTDELTICKLLKTTKTSSWFQVQLVELEEYKLVKVKNNSSYGIIQQLQAKLIDDDCEDFEPLEDDEMLDYVIAGKLTAEEANTLQSHQIDQYKAGLDLGLTFDEIGSNFLTTKANARSYLLELDPTLYKYEEYIDWDSYIEDQLSDYSESDGYYFM